MAHYTFTTTEWYEIEAESAILALQELHRRNIFPQEYRNDDKYQDEFHLVDNIILD